MVTKIPGTQWRPLGEQTEPKMSAHDIICLHTMDGFLTSTDDLFRDGGYFGTEAHFGIGGIWGSDEGKDLDGVIYQWQDLERTADSNFEGNPRVISIETADNTTHGGQQIKPWTDRQVEAIVGLVAELCTLYDIPAEMVPDSKPGRRGLAVHRQGIPHSLGIGAVPGWLVEGGEQWTTDDNIGKVCPGDARIKQFKDVVIPAVQARLDGDDVQEKDIAEIVKRVVAEVKHMLETERIVPNQKLSENKDEHPDISVAAVLSNIELNQDQDHKLLAAIHQKIVG